MVSTGALETVRKPRCELGGLKAYLSSGQQLKEKDRKEEKKNSYTFLCQASGRLAVLAEPHGG